MPAELFAYQASLKKMRTTRFSSLNSIFPSRASHPNAIETNALGASTPFSSALKLHSPLDRKYFQTKPAVSPILSVSNTVNPSLIVVWHFPASLEIWWAKFFALVAPFSAVCLA
jgi:hypothetical protein